MTYADKLKDMKKIYLDNAATSFPKAPGVAEAVARCLGEVGANAGRGAYTPAAEAGRAVLETRRALCRIFAFSGPESHAVLTPGATFGLNLLLRGFLCPGDHVVVSSLEHNAVMRPLAALEALGVTVSRVPAEEDGVTRPERIAPCLKKNTKLLLINHASNVSGGLFPLTECAALCREKGLPLAVDAAQTAGVVPIDFDGLGLTALCVPGHKGLLGPQGTGAVLLAPDFAQELSPLVAGGTGSFSDFERQPDFLPDKFEAGTVNLPGIYGLRAALSYVEDQTPAALGRREVTLTAHFLEKLRGLPIRVAGAFDAPRTGIVSLDFPNLDNAEASFRLERDFGILTRCGLHCAPAAHRALGTFPQGTVRFSVGHATTEDDIDMAADAVRTILEVK